MEMRMFCRHAKCASIMLLLLCGMAGGVQGAVTATDTATLQTDVNGDGKVNRGDTIRQTITIDSSAAATGMSLSVPLDADTVLVPGSLKTTPVAVDDSYTSLGNVGIQVSAPGVLNNDFGMPGPEAVAIDGTSEKNGTFKLLADGSFSYTPPAGFEGTDTFTYTATNSQGTQTGKVTITVSGMIWFVKADAAAGGDGRLDSPFNCLVGATCYGSASAKKAGDAVFLYSGSFPGGMTLLDNQKIIGQGAGADIVNITGLTLPANSAPLPATGGTRPVVTGGIVLAKNNTLRGFDLKTTTGTAITGTNFTTFAASDMLIDADNGALNLTNGTATVTFGSVSSRGGASNISLANAAGSLTLGSGALSGATANAFSIAGGSATTSFAGTISKASAGRLADITGMTDGSVTLGGDLTCNGSCTGINVATNTKGTFTFSGSSKVLNTDTAQAVTISGNGTSAAVNFTNGGLAITTTSGVGFGAVTTNASPIGNVTVSGASNTISTSSGAPLTLQNINSALTFDTVSATGATTGVGITNIAGTVNLGNGTLTSSGGSAISIANGAATVTYNGTISKSSAGRLADFQGNTGGSVTLGGKLTCDTSCTGINIATNTGGTYTFSGAANTFSTGASAAITILNNGSNAAVNFTGGGLAITTTSGEGFKATTAQTDATGTITVTGSGNSITSTTGTPLTVQKMKIGSAGLTFQSISANGAPNGIVLDKTYATLGASGGLTVTGTGSAGTGGTIQNITNRGGSFINTEKIKLSWMNFTNTGTSGFCSAGDYSNCNAGIHLNTVSDVTLNRLTLSGGNNQGINGLDVTTFSLADSTIANFGDGVLDNGLRIRNLLGTCSITNSIFQGNQGNQAAILNGTGSLTLSVTGSTFRNSSAMLYGLHGFVFTGDTNANMTLTLQNSTFDHLMSNGFYAEAVENATAKVTVSGSTFDTMGAASVNIVQGNAANMKFNILNNTKFVGNGSHVISINQQTTSTSGSLLQGTISGNKIGTQGSSKSATTAGSGIRIVTEGQGTTIAKVDGNTIDEVTEYGIMGRTGVNVAENNLQLTVTNNTVRLSDALSLYGIYVKGGVFPEDQGSICADIKTNTASNSNGGNATCGAQCEGIRINQYRGTIRFPFYAGGSTDDAAVTTLLTGRNTSTARTSHTGTPASPFSGGGACIQSAP